MLPDTLKVVYHQEVRKIEEELKVSYMTTAEWVGHGKGLEEGLKQGRVEGRTQGERAILLSQLECKFKNVPTKYEQLIRNADPDTLLVWGRNILTAETIEDVFCN